jgi:hypothetical protein
MVLDHHEFSVQDFLQSHGFTVSKISETDRQMPDFLVQDQNHEYIIEVKGKETDQSFMALLESPTPGKKELSLGYRDRLSGIIRKGVNQLDSYESGNSKFKVVWFALNTIQLEKVYLREGETSLPWLENIVGRQLFSTLYGHVDVEGYTHNRKFFQSGCFYFTNSEFFRYKQLHAVVIQSTEGLLLCVNDLSDRYHELRETRLHQLFKQKGLFVAEPYRIEEEGRCLLVHGDIDRRDEGAVIAFLIQKYNLLDLKVYNYVLFNMPLDQKRT